MLANHAEIYHYIMLNEMNKGKGLGLLDQSSHNAICVWWNKRRVANSVNVDLGSCPEVPAKTMHMRTHFQNLFWTGNNRYPTI